jgi:hypothetical protein
LYKTKPIGQRGPWRGVGAAVYETLHSIDRFNARRLLELLGYLLLMQFENAFFDHNSRQIEAS